jgi:Lrp/AsnC family leucine-responsive transcriptional regulator
MNLDKLDQKILAELQRDGRLSHVELATRVGLTPTPCTRRVRELETAGVIQGYTAVLDPRKVGHTIQAMVQIKLERHSDDLADRFRRELLERPEVMACYVMTGEMDFLVHVVVRDIDALSDFTLRRLLRMSGVRDVRSSIVLETVKRSMQVPVDVPT